MKRNREGREEGEARDERKEFGGEPDAEGEWQPTHTIG